MPPPVILLLVPRERAARIALCAPRRSIVRQIAFGDTELALRSAFGGIVVVDPRGWHDEALVTLAESSARYGVRVVIYSDLTTELSRQLVALGQTTAPEVVLHGTDDSAPRLVAALERHFASVPALLLVRLAPRLLSLDPRHAAQILSLFAWGAIPSRAREMSESLEVSAKTMLQWNARAGLAPTSRVLRHARVARAFELLASAGRVDSVWDGAGFGSVGRMRVAFGDLLGCPPSHAVRLLSAAAAADRLLRGLIPSADPTSKAGQP